MYDEIYSVTLCIDHLNRDDGILMIFHPYFALCCLTAHGDSQILRRENISPTPLSS